MFASYKNKKLKGSLTSKSQFKSVYFLFNKCRGDLLILGKLRQKMSFTDFITDNGRIINRDNFIHLIQMAQADGRVDSGEMTLLHRYGRRFSLTDPEIDSLIASEQSHLYRPPYELEKRFAQLYDAVQIMNADSSVTEQERKLFRKIAIAGSFTEEVIPRLLDFILEGVREGLDEEELFERFRKAKYLQKQ